MPSGGVRRPKYSPDAAQTRAAALGQGHPDLVRLAAGEHHFSPHIAARSLNQFRRDVAIGTVLRQHGGDRFPRRRYHGQLLFRCVPHGRTRREALDARVLQAIFARARRHVFGGIEEALGIRIPRAGGDRRCLLQRILHRKFTQNRMQEIVRHQRFNRSRSEQRESGRGYCRATREMACTNLRYGISS
jgi:hypothetical protein